MVKSNFWPGLPGAHVENNNRGIARYRSSIASVYQLNAPWKETDQKQMLKPQVCWGKSEKKNQNVCD